MSIKPKSLHYANTLYNSQVGALILLGATVFKVSSLPGVVASDMHSSTVWAYLLMTALDLVILAAVYVFSHNDGDARLRQSKSFAYKILLAVAMLYFAFKGLIYFAFATQYIKGELFDDVKLFVIVGLVLAPIAYMGIKGAKTIARVTEIVFIPLLLLLAVNLIFVKTDMDFGRNLPVLNAPFGEFASASLKYGVWLGDLTPLLFVKTNNKKLPWIGVCSLFSAAFVNVVALLGIAMYGEGLPLVNNMLIKLGSFNQLSLEIGRIEWTALTAISVMGAIEVALLHWGVTQCAERLFNNKKAQVAALQITRYGYPVILFGVVVGVPKLGELVKIPTSSIGYAMTAFALALPILCCVLLLISARRNKHNSMPDAAQTAPVQADDGVQNNETVPQN